MHPRRRSGPDRSVRFWSGPGRILSALAASPALLALALSTAGCGGATAPCPTPTKELDRLRGESEKLERNLAGATREERTRTADRDEMARRIAAAQTALDSLARAEGR